MITAVDSNILLDIFTDAPEFTEKSTVVLRQQQAAGKLVACNVVWAEVATFFKEPHELNKIMQTINVEFDPILVEAAIEAAKAWKFYKASGGKRERLIADFLIGGHALIQCDCLLSRDRGFYRRYFKNIRLISP